METILYQVSLKDGRVFRIFCANATQKRKTIQSFQDKRDKIETVTEVKTGIHTVKEWNEILTTF